MIARSMGVTCGKFEVVGADVNTHTVTMSAPISPAPDALWRRAFAAEEATEAMIGNRIGTGACIGADHITFSCVDGAVEASASIARRVIDRTNAKAAEARTRLDHGRDAEKRRSDEYAQRLKEKYRDGV